MANALQKNFNSARVLFPCISHITSSAVNNRAVSIQFPERPSITQRYVRIDAIKSMSIPSRPAPVQNIPPHINFAAFDSKPVVEEDYVKSNGISVVFADVLPTKYRKPVLSDEEIDCIMRGGGSA